MKDIPKPKPEDVEELPNMFFDPDGKPITIGEWNILFADRSQWTLKTMVKGQEVSTIYIGVNHDLLGTGPPQIYETMVFGGHSDHLRRYATWEAARKGHEEIVRYLGEST